MTEQVKDLTNLSNIINEQQRRIQDLEIEKAALRQTLKDQFAMAALQGLLAAEPNRKDHMMGARSYEIAREMLQARK